MKMPFLSIWGGTSIREVSLESSLLRSFRFNKGWQSLSRRAAWLFGVIVMISSLALDIYSYAIADDPTNGKLFAHVVESLFLAAFTGSTLYFVLQYLLSLTVASEARARQNEARFQAVFEYNMDAILVTRPDDGGVETANTAAQELFGMTETEFKRRGRHRLVDQSDPRLPDYLAQRKRNKRIRGELRLVRNDGTTFEGVVSSAFFRNASGDLRSVMHVRDITEEQGRELRLATSEARYRAVFEYSLDALILSTPDGWIEAVNPAAEKLFGYSIQEFRKVSRDGLVAPEDKGLKRLLQNRDRHGWARDTARYRRGDGVEFTADVASALFTDFQGAKKAVTVIHDVSDREEQNLRLRESEDRYRSLYLQSADAILITAPDGTIYDCNPAAERLFGMSQYEICRLGRAGLTDESDVALKNLLAERRRAGRARGTIYMRRNDDEWFLADVSIAGYRDMQGRERTSVVLRDITEQRRAEERMRLITAAFQSADECMLICDSHFYIREMNDAYLTTTGFQVEDVLGSRPNFLDIEGQARTVGQGLAADGHWQGELMQRRADGKLFVSRSAISSVEHYEADRNHVVVTFSDISGVRSIEERLEYLTLHDSLTGLPNRDALKSWFREQAANTEWKAALLYVDLARFKIINEIYGHSAGDKLLQDIAYRLRKQLGSDEYIARMGGDDFLIVIGGIDTERQAVKAVRRFLKAIGRPYRMMDENVVNTANVGISLYPHHAREFEDLMRAADAALHAAKEKGRGSYCSFLPEMREAIERQTRVENELRHALGRGELRLEYQAIAELPNSAVIGAEALVRWESPTLGLVSPGEFIPVAEETGVIGDIGYWVVASACQDLIWFWDSFPQFKHVSVNVSTLQLRQPGFARRLEEIVDEHGVSPARVRLEITESVMLLDPELAVAVLGELRDCGFSIAIDDFGTGYSSMTYLRRLPVQYLKLDQSFIQRLPGSESDANIVRSIIELAHRLGIGVVAEGIETESQFQLLVDWGCDEAQGYLLARPADAEALRSLLRGKTSGTQRK